MSKLQKSSLYWKLKRTALLLCAGATGFGAELRVELVNSPSTGAVALLLFDSPDSFRKLTQPVRSIQIPAEGQRVFTLPGIKPGRFGGAS